jgi:hypothetical protein
MGNDAVRLGPLDPAPVLEVTLGPGGLLRGPVPDVPAFKHAGLAAAEDTLFEGYKPHGDAVSVEDVTELTEQDVLEAPAPNQANSGSTGPAIRSLRYQHHEIARLLAAGTRPSEIARVLDITTPTIARLIATPQFQDLLHGYTLARDKAAIDIGVRLKVAGAIALDKLTEKLEGMPPEALGAEWLSKTTFGLVDRAGHSPVQRTFHASVATAISPADIRAMRLERSTRTVVLAPHSSEDGALSGHAEQGRLVGESAGRTDAPEEGLGAPSSASADAMARDEAAGKPVVPEP